MNVSDLCWCWSADDIGWAVRRYDDEHWTCDHAVYVTNARHDRLMERAKQKAARLWDKALRWEARKAEALEKYRRNGS